MMEQDRDDSNTRLFYWSNATPACYHIVARGLFCFMGSSQEIPTPSCVCVRVHECVLDLLLPNSVCVSASRNAANKSRGVGLQGAVAGTKQQRLPGVCE